MDRPGRACRDTAPSSAILPVFRLRCNRGNLPEETHSGSTVVIIPKGRALRGPPLPCRDFRGYPAAQSGQNRSAPPNPSMVETGLEEPDQGTALPGQRPQTAGRGAVPTNDTYFLQAFQPIRQAPIPYCQRPDLGNLSPPMRNDDALPRPHFADDLAEPGLGLVGRIRMRHATPASLILCLDSSDQFDLAKGRNVSLKLCLGIVYSLIDGERPSGRRVSSMHSTSRRVTALLALMVVALTGGLALGQDAPPPGPPGP